MTIENLHITPLSKSDPIPYHLLLEAEPSKEIIDKHIKSGTCYLGKNLSKVVGAMILCPLDLSRVEIKNIAVDKKFRRKGFGRLLLRYAEEICLEKGYRYMTIGTGNSSILQLKLYQSLGYEMKKLEKNFFLKHYDVPIFENGIQCKHLIMLEKKL